MGSITRKPPCMTTVSVSAFADNKGAARANNANARRARRRQILNFMSFVDVVMK